MNSVLDPETLLNSINGENSKQSKDPQKFRSESTSKMMENISSQENKIKNLNLHDRDKLYIKDIKNNIHKLESISNE